MKKNQSNHQSNGESSFEAHLNKTSRSRSQSASKNRSQFNDSHDHFINMVHGSSFSWDESDQSHFSAPLKNHDNLSIIDTEPSNFDECHEMIMNFTSSSGSTALNRTVEKPLKSKLQNLCSEQEKKSDNLYLKPQLKNVFTQAANASIENIKSSSNHKIAGKCPDSKKKSHHVAAVVFKIPNKEYEYRRKKFFSSFLLKDLEV